MAWEDACKPKNQGGLGIIDIERQNDALLMKHWTSFKIVWTYHGLTLLGPNCTLMFKPHLRAGHQLDLSSGKM